MKGYEIKYKKDDLPGFFISVVAADNTDEALKKFDSEGHKGKIEVVNVELVYSDIEKEFYGPGDTYGWD